MLLESKKIRESCGTDAALDYIYESVSNEMYNGNISSLDMILKEISEKDLSSTIEEDLYLLLGILSSVCSVKDSFIYYERAYMNIRKSLLDIGYDPELYIWLG